MQIVTKTCVCVLGAIAVALGVVSWHSPGFAAPCGDFHHPPKDLSAANSVYKLSVLHIKSGSDGTAFLIDNEDGLFLTARHVVEQSIPRIDRQSPVIPVIGRFEERESVPLNLAVIAHDEDLDIALLRAEDRQRVADRIPLELSFEDVASQKVGILGATFSGETETRIRLRVAETFDTDIHSGRWEVPVAVRPGDSGAPLLKDDDGLVVAVVLSKRTTDLAIALPLLDVAEFLERHAVSSIPQEISEHIASSANLDMDVMSRAFRTRPSSVASNFELAGLTNFLWKYNPRPRIPNALDGCPLFHVARNRELGEYAAFLFAMSSLTFHSGTAKQKAEVARSIFKAAETEEERGNQGNALALYSAAARVFHDATRDRLTEAGSESYLANWYDSREAAQIEASSGAKDRFLDAAYGTLLISPPKEPGMNAQQSNSLAALLHDYQVALRRAAELSPRGVTDGAASKALVTAAWGTKVARSSEFAGANFQALGDMLVRFGRYDNASRAYAGAWQNGYSTPTVLNNFKYSQIQTGHNLSFNEATLIDLINNTAPLDNATLREIVAEVGE